METRIDDLSRSLILREEKRDVRREEKLSFVGGGILFHVNEKHRTKFVD